MNYYKLFIVLFAMFFENSSCKALKAQSILGGKRVTAEHFDYQVGIAGKKNKSDEIKTVGAGAIISENHIISILSIFFSIPSYKLKEITFYAIVGSNDMKNPRIIIEIDEIYRPYVKTSTLFNDISVAKVKQSFFFNSMKISKIPVRFDEESLIGYRGVVSGYGYNSIQIKQNNETGERKIKPINFKAHLHYMEVDIVNHEYCPNISPINKNIFQMCGVTKLSLASEPQGICKGDGGSPLVINDVLVGLAADTTEDCNNNVYGALYTNVSCFMYFTNAILRDDWKHIAIAYPNLPHIL